jgi:hypothetical protein
MTLNPILRNLGFSPSDRVVIVHADDVGMCQASVPAFFELADRGLVSFGSVMVPALGSARRQLRPAAMRRPM